MGVVTFTRSFPTDAYNVWSSASDFARVHQYNFQVESTELLTPKSTGVGAERLCKRYDGKKSRERIMMWDDDSMRYEIEVVSGLPFDDARATIEVIQDIEDDERCTLVGKFSYTVAWGPLGALFDKFVLNQQLNTIFELYAAGIEYHLLTGKTVVQNFSLKMLADVQ